MTTTRRTRRRKSAAAAPSAEAATTTVEVRRRLLPKPTVVSRALDGAGAHVLRISSFGTRTAAEAPSCGDCGARAGERAAAVLDLRDNDGGLLPGRRRADARARARHAAAPRDASSAPPRRRRGR